MTQPWNHEESNELVYSTRAESRDKGSDEVDRRLRGYRCVRPAVEHDQFAAATLECRKLRRRIEQRGDVHLGVPECSQDIDRAQIDLLMRIHNLVQQPGRGV